MTITTFDAVFYTAIFILPGFIIKTIINVLNPPKKEKDATLFLSYLTYSLVNLALCSWAYVLVSPLSDSECTLHLYWLALLGITIVGSIVASIIIGFLKYHRVMYKLAQKFSFNVIDPTPTAWDFWFHKTEPSFVVVTLKDGSQIHGWFGSNSFASSDEQERDLFIEKIYHKLDDGSMKTIPESCGIYISKDIVKFIEFINYERSPSCQTTKTITATADTMAIRQDL